MSQTTPFSLNVHPKCKAIAEGPAGTHLGGWRGLPATGRRVEFPLCGVYTFDPDDHLAGEKIYYDRGTVLRQLGVFHEPRSLLGQISILATHPTTIVRAFARKLLRQ